MNPVPTPREYHSPAERRPGNLTLSEQALYVVGGLALAAAGTKPRPNFLLNIVALGAGAYLAWRGTQGYCPMKAAIDGHRA
ncbi:hypothetical protein CR162_09285 [Pseudoroseomonas rhizosphaerae]|uniref:DUF2892 domain-containing protein n=1 Tax=Teichococcus rhizosphaerae TaxID=1335062 RepID=A0A2C7ADZ6_9PROT|nr:hypothetical protein [Pseudoroseomonas rhizosphaerae]PHK95346.1 hypothetical protein CR162_09285 [Pseudoroseomonas rhizosphaerae]